MLYPFLFIGNLLFFTLEAVTFYNLWEYTHGFTSIGLAGMWFTAYGAHYRASMAYLNRASNPFDKG